MSVGDAQLRVSLYETGTRVIIWERGRLAIGEVMAVDETPREPMYGIRFSTERKMMFRACEVVAFTPARYEALVAAMGNIFAGFSVEDEEPARRSA
jgi:hypothetical protein